MNFCTFVFLPDAFFMLEILMLRDAHTQTLNEQLNVKQSDLLCSDNINWEIRQPTAHNRVF